eukprot:646069_1
MTTSHYTLSCRHKKISQLDFKASIPESHVYTVEGYVRSNFDSPQEITNLILFMYAKPMVMKIRFINDVKRMLYYTVNESKWEQLTEDIRSHLNVSSYAIISALIHNDDTRVTGDNWSAFTWDDEDLFCVESDLVELHCELEIDYSLLQLSILDDVMIQCIASVLKIKTDNVYVEAPDDHSFVNHDGTLRGLFYWYTPTTKFEIEELVSMFYKALASEELQQKMLMWSECLQLPNVEIRELYETDLGDSD